MDTNAATGRQPDGSYVPCSACHYEPPEHRGPGVPVRQAGTIHHVECSTLPKLTPSAELLARLAEIKACEGRAWAQAHTAVIV